MWKLRQLLVMFEMYNSLWELCKRNNICSYCIQTVVVARLFNVNVSSSLQIESEENVLICLRIIIELHKQFRPPISQEVRISALLLWNCPWVHGVILIELFSAWEILSMLLRLSDLIEKSVRLCFQYCVPVQMNECSQVHIMKIIKNVIE